MKSKSKFIRWTGSTLYLSEEACELLKVGKGDKVCIRFTEVPVVALPSVIGEDNGGNTISTTLGVSCKGSTGRAIQAFGDQFSFELESEGYLVLSKISPDELEKEIQSEEKDMCIALSPVDGEEIDFEFDIKDK